MDVGAGEEARRERRRRWFVRASSCGQPVNAVSVPPSRGVCNTELRSNCLKNEMRNGRAKSEPRYGNVLNYELK